MTLLHGLPPVNFCPPDGLARRPAVRRSAAFATLLFFVASAWPSACAGQKKSPLDDPNRIGHREVAQGEPDFYSPQQEIEMGRQMAREFEELATMYGDP